MTRRVTRAEALAQGLTRYYTGKPCPQGHMAERRVANTSCVVCVKIGRQAWAQANKEQCLNTYRAWRETNAERYANSYRQWRKNNPEAKRLEDHRRRARERGAEGCSNREDILQLFVTQEGLCNGCTRDLAATGYHVDHIQPLSRGGSNWPENLQLLCPTCNSSKGVKTMDEWLFYKTNFPLKKET